MRINSSSSAYLIHCTCQKRIASAWTRLRSIGFAVLWLAFASLCAQQASAEPIGRTRLLAISICPPWKPLPIEVCRVNAKAVADAFHERLDIAPGDITTLVNEAATTSGVKAAFAGLGSLGRSERLIVYVNLHAGAMDRAEARPDNDVFVLWTEKKPAAMQFAVAEGDWMLARDFAALLHSVSAGEVIVVIDACESDAVSPLFVHAHPANDPTQRKAVVVSATSDEFANYTADRSLPLFSQQLVRAVEAGRSDLGQAVDAAASSTTAAAIPICNALKQTITVLGLPASACVQHPVMHDPDGLLQRLPLKG